MSDKGFYTHVPLFTFAIMSKTRYPSEIRCTVTHGSQPQIQLPGRFVSEVGAKSGAETTFESAKAMWYYHEKDEKAVLAVDGIDRSSLEPQQIAALSGVSNEDIDSGDVSGARVTIPTTLPDSLYDRLTQADEVVLKPVYPAHYQDLEHLCISVYPAGEFDRGDLPNVDWETRSSSDEATSHGGHTNSV